jgi:hypothetical protein
MLDTITPVTAEITKLITAGIPEGELLTRVTLQFPDLTWRELSQALQVAQDTAEKRALRPH